MLEPHPYADIFPMLERLAADELRGDIAAHGLRDRVVLFQGRILDGRNRYRALVEIAKLGLAYRGETFTEADLVPGASSTDGVGWGDFFEDFSGSEAEALEYVLSKNLHRRHLNESQRAMVAANLATLKPGRPEADKPANLRDYRQADAAQRLHVSERSVQDARVVREHGIDDINAAVQSGDLAVSAAAQLARLPAEEQAKLIREHADPKALSRVAKEIRAEKQAAKAEKREERERALGAKQRALPTKKYGVILADPEWKYSVWSRETGGDKLPDNHYPTSELDTIKARDVGSIAADDCVLFLWVVAPFLDAGLDVLKAWGFDFVTCLVWNKVYPGDRHGLGYWFRVDHEIVLVGKRGEPPCPALGTQFPSIFSAPVGEHSAKPDRVHEIAEAYFPNLPKIELNARRKRPGWDVWGLEADGEQVEAVDLPAVSEALAVVVVAPSTPMSAEPTALALPDADVVRIIGTAVTDALGNGASLRAGDSRLHTVEERLIRRHVIRIAFDSFSISFPRLAAVLGGTKQAAAQLRLTAAGEVAADPGLPARLSGVVADVTRRLGR